MPSLNLSNSFRLRELPIASRNGEPPGDDAIVRAGQNAVPWLGNDALATLLVWNSAPYGVATLRP